MLGLEVVFIFFFISTISRRCYYNIKNKCGRAFPTLKQKGHNTKRWIFSLIMLIKWNSPTDCSMYSFAQPYFWGAHYVTCMVRSHASWDDRRHPGPQASPRKPHRFGARHAQGRGAENKSSERRLQDGDTSSAQEEGCSCAKRVGEQTWNSKRVSSCFCSFRQQERKAGRGEGDSRCGCSSEGTLPPKPRKATEAHRVTPSFPGNKTRVYRVCFLGNGTRKPRNKMLS